MIARISMVAVILALVCTTTTALAKEAGTKAK